MDEMNNCALLEDALLQKDIQALPSPHDRRVPLSFDGLIADPDLILVGVTQLTDCAVSY